MDTIASFESVAPVVDDDDQDWNAVSDQHANEGDDRRYSAEATLDVLDPYTAIIDGVPAPASKP